MNRTPDPTHGGQLHTAAVIDLTTVPEDRRRHALADLAGLPHAAGVIVRVGDLDPDPGAAAVLHELLTAQRLVITIEGHPAVAAAWTAAVRDAGRPAPWPRPHLTLVDGGAGQ